MVVVEKMAWTVPKSCTNVVSVATDELTAATNNEAGGLGRSTDDQHTVRTTVVSQVPFDFVYFLANYKGYWHSTTPPCTAVFSTVSFTELTVVRSTFTQHVFVRSVLMKIVAGTVCVWIWNNLRGAKFL